MARTERARPGNHKAPRNASTQAAQRSQTSRSITKLLRHQAENEKIPITSAGWVKLEDLLAWKGLHRTGDAITLTDVFEIVEEDGKFGKGRFEVQHIADNTDSFESETLPSNDSDEPGQLQKDSIDIDGAATGEMVEATASLTLSNAEPQSQRIDPSSKNTPATQLALQHHYTYSDTPPTHYLIRASQGHSIKSIDSTSTHTPLTLTSPNLPTTVVHGTFYASWSAILRTGGLKPMGRNNVHFATGPPLSEVLSLTTTNHKPMSTKLQVDEVLSRNKVISGMRWDAQLLIYIDLKHCLEDIATKKLDMNWWISGNGVVLTEGVTVDDQEPTAGGIPQDPNEPVIASSSAKAQKARENLRHIREKQKQREQERIVPMKYWDKVVDIKNGLGVVWEQGRGVVQELPQRLRDMPLPQGKGRVHGKGRGGGKPRLNVERGNQNLKNGRGKGDDEEEEE